ncbi:MULTISPECIES: hypothetical protein [unclassified Methylibium]|uniref:hypothetical protein n=1 Tax=unclassified Methylibium TaxID=2633235 RepID=UPI0003F3FB70|nr:MULTISPECIES: hypothetical protein [unclassified Methylibium]EWS55707.1 hypothetical protein X551_01453 [Methylibium sp. T29]EWS59751.1 hypothetical protein Y694_02459 [Methylibium sp. T29-B]
MQKPARFLVLIESDGMMLARLFDAERRQLAEFDASSEEVAVMSSGLLPSDAAGALWEAALAGHSEGERQAARVYTLDV